MEWTSSDEELSDLDNEDRRNDNEYKMKLDLHTFNSRMDIETFLEWVKNVETFFKYANIPARKKVQFVEFKLKGALAWWEQLEINQRRCGKKPIKTWEKMKK